MDEEVQNDVQWMDAFEQNRRKYFTPLGESSSRAVPPVEKPPQLEQKQLPNHLRYACLGQSSTLPVIISASLLKVEEEKLLRVLREHKATISWSLADLKGICPSMCMHQILLEDNHNPLVKAQRRLN